MSKNTRFWTMVLLVCMLSACGRSAQGESPSPTLTTAPSSLASEAASVWTVKTTFRASSGTITAMTWQGDTLVTAADTARLSFWTLNQASPITQETLLVDGLASTGDDLVLRDHYYGEVSVRDSTAAMTETWTVAEFVANWQSNSLAVHDNQIASLTTGQRVAVVTRGDAAVSEVTLDTPFSEGATAVAWSPDGTTLAVGSSEGTIALWSWPSKQPGATIMTRHAIERLAWSMDGTTLLAAGKGGIYRWSPPAATGEQIPLDPYLIDLALQPRDGGLVAVVSNAGVVSLWEPASAMIVHTLALDYPATRVAWSSDGVHLAIGGDRGLTVWSSMP